MLATATLLVVGLAAGCATRPDLPVEPDASREPSAAAAWADPAASSGACPRIAADMARTAQARAAAVKKGENAWKTVLPLAVVAVKVSSRTAVDAADERMAALRAEAASESCESR